MIDTEPESTVRARKNDNAFKRFYQKLKPHKNPGQAHQPEKERSSSQVMVTASHQDLNPDTTSTIKPSSKPLEAASARESLVVTLDTNVAALNEHDLDVDADLVPDEEASLRIQAEDEIRYHEAPVRDLWDEAWNSPDLPERARNLLVKLQKSAHNDFSNEPSTLPEHDPSIQGNKPTKAGQNEEHIADISYYVQQVATMTEQKVTDYHTRWGTQPKDKAKEILVSVLTVKTLIDAGLKFDPSGYGSAAWAVVSFGLTLVKNDKDRMDSVFASSAFLSQCLGRYCKIQTFYQQSSPDKSPGETKELEDAITEVYIAILSYSAEVQKANQETSWSRIKKSLIALADQPFKQLKNTIEEKEIIVEKWMDIVDRAYDARFKENAEKNFNALQMKPDATLDKLQKLSNDVASTKVNTETLLNNDTLDLLSPLETSSSIKHENLRKTLERLGTIKVSTERFTRWQAYKNWQTYPQSVLWLHAPSGCGKSSLCCSIIEHLAELREAEDPPQKLLVYWYFQYDKKDTKDLTPVFRSFLRQLLLANRQHDGFPKGVVKWLADVVRQQPAPDARKLFAKVKDIMKNLNRDIYIVLDGLDEFASDSSDNVRKLVLELLSSLIKEANNSLHILIVSKHDDDIKQCLLGDDELTGIVEQMNVEYELSSELQTFIDKTMEKDKYFSGLPYGVKTDVSNRLQEGEEKSFLWVTELLGELRTCHGNKEQIREQLKKVPGSMAKRYDECLNSVKEVDQKFLRQILMWLLRHQRPGELLTVDEVAVAANISSATEPNDLLKTVEALVKTEHITAPTSDEDDGAKDQQFWRINFVHFSAKEHLESLLKISGSTESWFTFTDDEAHLLIAERCLEILLDEDDKGKPKKSPLTSYAAHHWHKHYQSISKRSTVTSQLDVLILRLFAPEADNRAFQAWLDVYNPDDDFIPSAYDFNIGEDDSYHHNYDSNDGGDDSNIGSDRDEKLLAHPVYYAVKLRLLDIAIQMLQDGAPCTRPGREGNVLQLALFNKHWEVADVLLRCCADVKSLVAARGGPHGTPLYIASALIEDDHLGTLEDLIRCDARATGAKDGKFGGALHAAAYFGQTSAVRLLLEKGDVDVNQRGGMFGTALATAAARLRTDIMQLLLDKGADPTMVDGPFGTALQAASVNYDFDIWDVDGVLLLRKAIKMHGICPTHQGHSGMSWRQAYEQVGKSHGHLLLRYMMLFRRTDNGYLAFELGGIRRLAVAGVMDRCGLRHGFDLRTELSSTTGLAFSLPAGEQLKDLLRALPNFSKDALKHELNTRDFYYKALFWSGIDYIVERLPQLVHDSLTSMEADPEFKELIASYLGFHSFEQRRALDETFSSHFRMRHYARRRKNLNPDVGDKIILEMIRQQQLHGKHSYPNGQVDRQDETRSMSSSGLPRDDKEQGDGDGEGDTNIHLVVDNLLHLMQDIVEFGKQCDQLHSVAAQRHLSSDPESHSLIDTETMQSLAFELLTAVARLATSIEIWKDNDNTAGTERALAQLTQTVRLLKTVRLPRINKLAAAAQHQLEGPRNMLMPGTFNSEGDDERLLLSQGTIASMLNELPSLMQKELTPVLDQMQEQLYKRLQGVIGEATHTQESARNT